jgi:hypothetical protein
MSTIYVEPLQKASEVLPLVRSAIDGEIARLELAVKLARCRHKGLLPEDLAHKM